MAGQFLGGHALVRVNYQREKRLKDLERQRKQEEKRNRKLHKDGAPDGPEEKDTPPLSDEGGSPLIQS